MGYRKLLIVVYSPSLPKYIPRELGPIEFAIIGTQPLCPLFYTPGGNNSFFSLSAIAKQILSMTH